MHCKEIPVKKKFTFAILNCRRSLDEKLYTRDLQLALKKSTANENALKSSNSDASKSHNEPLAVSGCESARPNDGNCHGATARLQPPSIIGQSGTSAHQLSSSPHWILDYNKDISAIGQ